MILIKKIVKLSLMIFFVSCEIDKTPLEPYDSPNVYAPSTNLSVDQILQLQGINSLHILKYDSVIINGTSHGFRLSFELYMDRERIRHIQYLNSSSPWIITVYDLKNERHWQYNNNLEILDYPSLPDLEKAFASLAKTYIATKLFGDPFLIDYQYVDNKRCAVIGDASLDWKEWVWIGYKLPIKWERSWYNEKDGIYQTTITQFRNIEVNIEYQEIPITKLR